jgi:formylglycine-generating enzyme required for sulfatase activity
MGRLDVPRVYLVVIAAAVFAALVVQIATAGGAASAGSKATTSAVSTSKFKKLKRQVAALQAQVNQLARQPGPQGPQGPAGSAPACQGNDPADVMVSAGSVCIDRYEVSVWDSPTGGTQYGVSSDDYPCNDNGQDCVGANAIYARSVAGVTPSTFITWFQAQQALANSGKRLPSNADWQQAVAGTPESTACNVSTGVVASTGANAGCISHHGANDMVGNVQEWVADWVPASTASPGWGAFSDDLMQLSGASTVALGPGAVIRGGTYTGGAGGGPFTISANGQPYISFTSFVGFRGAR